MLPRFFFFFPSTGGGQERVLTFFFESFVVSSSFLFILRCIFSRSEYKYRVVDSSLAAL